MTAPTPTGSKPRIHFTAPAGSCRDDIARFGFAHTREYLAFAREHLDRTCRLTANPRLFDVAERPDAGGRDDDDARLRDLQGALDDPRTRAIIAARGGSWFSRLVGRLDFSALRARSASNPLWAFGFSEITSLVNFVASCPAGRGVYWLCPNYLGWKVVPKSGRANLAGRAAFAEFWRALSGILNPRDPASPQSSSKSKAQDPQSPLVSALEAPILGRVVSGRPRSSRIRILGGCLSVLAATLPGSLARRLRPDGKWLLIEDIHEAPYRIDRQLSVFGLLGWFNRLAGVLVGDFHSQSEDQQSAAVETLKRHLPRRTPIITTRAVGHVWPMTPVPLNRPLRMRILGRDVRITTPWSV